MSGIASRTWQTVKPHVPLIKFRKGGPTAPEPRGSSGPASSSSAQTSKKSHQSQALAQVLEPYQLPRKYWRKPLDDQEIEYINRGGPA